MILRPGEHRCLHGHPWVFAGELYDTPSDLEPGEVAEVCDARGRTVGQGYCNPASAIIVRLLTRGGEQPGPEWARARLHEAVALRERWLPGVEDLRLVHAEADRLPGLIVERMAGYVVVSPDTLGAERLLLPWLNDDLQSLGERGMILRALSPSRQREGLEPRLELIGGTPPAGPVTVQEGPLRFRVDLFGGQKTGHYFDQRRNRAIAAEFAAGRRVLDAFSYTGGFALAAARAGATEVVAIESSHDAVEALAANAEANDCRIDVREENAFDLLRAMVHARERFGLIILDPPPFARGRSHLEAALRAYKEINLRALRLLEPGGVLCTASCSHAVGLQDFVATVRAAAADAGVGLRMTGSFGAAADHPVRLEVPETEYLHCLLLQRD